MTNLRWDPTTSDVSYGVWECPECKMQFYGGGRTLHEPKCKGKPSYPECTFLVGEKVRDVASRYALLKGEQATHPMLPVSCAEILNLAKENGK